MFDEKARAVLEQPLVARLAVNGLAGYPHVVPIWFLLDGDDIVMVTSTTTAKAHLLQANPKAAVTIGGDPGDASGGNYTPGYMIQGMVVVEPDEGFSWLRRITYHYESPEAAEKDLALWTEDAAYVVLRLQPEKVVKVM